MKMGRSSAISGIALAAILAVPAAGADEGPNLLDQGFQFSLGTFILNPDTKIRLDGSTPNSGTEVDWDKSFGGGDATRFRIDAGWRFAERHQVRAMWFDYTHSGSRVTDQVIDWGGTEIPVSTTVDAELKFSVYELFYEYAFLRRDNYELGASIGLHVADFSASLAATLATEGGGTEAFARKGSVTGPLPVIGLHWQQRLGRNFWINASGQFFALQYGDYDGNLQDWRFNVLWQPNRWVGVGVGYDSFNINVDVDADKFQGKLKWKYAGPQIFYSIAF